MNFILLSFLLCLSFEAKISNPITKELKIAKNLQYTTTLSNQYLSYKTIIHKDEIAPTISPNNVNWAISLSTMTTPSPTNIILPSPNNPLWAVSLSNTFSESPSNVLWATSENPAYSVIN